MKKEYKNLIWIDDNKDKIAQLVDNVFWKLWNKNIICYVFFIGDDYKEHLELPDYTDTDICNFIDNMADSYGEYCNMIELPEGTTPMQYFLDNYETYVNEKTATKLDYTKNTSDLIELIKKHIPDLCSERYAFAIDLRLYKNDYERIMNKNEPIESMRIIDTLKGKYSYFLYTSFKYDYPFEKKWKEILFEKYNLNNEEVCGSKKLFSKEGNEEFNKLLKICEIKKEDKNETVNEQESQ